MFDILAEERNEKQFQFQNSSVTIVARTGPHISENVKYASAAKTFYEDTNNHKAKPKYVLTVKFHVLSAQEFQLVPL